jgi:hypothetical protein
MNHSNKDGTSPAESGEERPLIKENAGQPNTYPTQSGKGVSQGLAGVRKAARENKEMKFTALLHHLTVDLLRESFYSLKRKAAPGVDGVTWQEYEDGLEDRLTDHLIDKRQEDSWEALIEALTPDLPLTSDRMIEAKMFAHAMKGILESDDFAKATDIAEIAHFSKRNPSCQPNRWKKTGLIFAVPYKGVDLYPLYALELKKGAKPLPIMKKVLQVLADKDDWKRAFWSAA